MQLPKIGDTVIYIQPDCETPHGGTREHAARVIGFGTTRFESLIDVEVTFAALPAPEGANADDFVERKIVKRDVAPHGLVPDIGNGEWKPEPLPVEVAPAPQEDATG